MPHSNIPPRNIAFNAITHGKLRSHVKAAFLLEVEIMNTIRPSTLLRKGVYYDCFYERFPNDLPDETIIKCIASFQQHYDGPNIVVIRPYNPKLKG